MNLLPFPKRVTAIASLCEGQSIRATARILKAHHNTIMRLGRQVTSSLEPDSVLSAIVLSFSYYLCHPSLESLG